MRIGIDARFWGPVGKGLGRYTQKLIENLEKIDTNNQYFVFLKKENFTKYKSQNKNFHKVLANYPWYTFSEQLKFPRLLKKYKLDLVHFPHFNVPILYKGKFVVTIHDLILIHFPTVRSSTLSPIIYWIKFLVYKVVIRLAIYRSCKVIAVSQFTKKDILKEYKKVTSKKIIVTYEACEDFSMSSSSKEDEILSKYAIIKPYLIYVGNVYPHKNPERLVLAMNLVRRKIKGLRLVFVGGEDYFYRRLKKFVSQHKIENIIFADYVPDYELDILYHNAKAYIRPSLYEGFELPPLEAMAKGVPVLSSKHSCAVEILGKSAFYFDPKNIKDISQAIIKVSSDQLLRKKLIQKGYQQVDRYSWKKMGEITLNLYKEIIEKEN
jgi:glycosyltransferase involved in cell wall biosynthesis